MRVAHGAREVAELGLELAKRVRIDPLRAGGAARRLAIVHELENASAVEWDVNARLVAECAQERGIEVTADDRKVSHWVAGQLLAFGARREHSGACRRGFAEARLANQQHRCPPRRRLGGHRQTDEPCAQDHHIGRSHPSGSPAMRP